MESVNLQILLQGASDSEQYINSSNNIHKINDMFMMKEYEQFKDAKSDDAQDDQHDHDDQDMFPLAE